MNRHDEAPRAVDKPEVGFFRMRMVRSGPFIAARISHGDDGWGAELDGKPVGPSSLDPAFAPGVFLIWHSGTRIDEAEYNYLLELSQWARAHDPQHPAADPWRPIDLTQTKPLY